MAPASPPAGVTPAPSQHAQTNLFAEIAAGDGLSLAQAARRLPGRGGKGTAPTTLFRWAASGVRAPDGRLVKLEACRIGRRMVTTAGAVARFLSATNDDPAAATVVLHPTSAVPAGNAGTTRSRDLARAMDELRAAGV